MYEYKRFLLKTGKSLDAVSAHLRGVQTLDPAQFKSHASEILKSLPVSIEGQNIGFCVVMGEVEGSRQKELAWIILAIMASGKFSWQPLSDLYPGLCVGDTLVKIGIITEVENKQVTELIGNGGSIPDFVQLRLIEKFELPTVFLNPERILTGREKAYRIVLNAMYSSRTNTSSKL